MANEVQSTGGLDAGGGGGSGTVTSVSVVTANGISGSVANATTTPAITLSLTGYVPYTGATTTVDLGTHEMLVGNGSVAAPSIGISSAPTSGFWKNATYGALNWGSAGVFGGLFEASGLYVKSTGILAFLNTDAESASADVVLKRDAANVLSMGTASGSAAQTFRIYGTNTGNKYLNLTHDGTDAIITANSGNVKLKTSVVIRDGVLTDAITSNFLSVTGTLNSTNTLSDPVGVRFNITTPAMGSPSQTPEMQAVQVQFNGTGVMTGIVLSMGLSIGNDVSSGATALVTAFPATGTALSGLAGDAGAFNQANSAGVASLSDKIGAVNRAGNGPQNFGSINIAAVNDANINIGTAGVSKTNTGKAIGGHFQIGTTLPTWHTAAVSADIGSSSGYVFYGSKSAGATEIFTVSNIGLTTITTTSINGTCLNVIGDNKNTEIKWTNLSGSGNSYGLNASNATASLANSFYLSDYTNSNHVLWLINNSGDFMFGSALSNTTGTGATAYFPVSGTILLNNPTTINGKTTLTGGTLASGTNSFVLTTTMPTSMSGVTSAINWTITGAGSSSQNNRAMLFTYAAGYTGSSKNIAIEIDNLNAGTGTGLNLTGAATNPAGNSALNATTLSTTTGTNQAGYYDASGGNINIGAVGKSVGNKASATNVGLIGAAINAGATSKQIGVLAYIASSDDPTYTSAALVADNGSSASPIAVFSINGTVTAKIDNLGNIIDNATGTALSIHATQGFSYLATCAGTPDGTPSVLPTGAIPYIIDTTGGKLWAYYGSAWHFALLT